MSRIFFNFLSGNIDTAPDISSKNFFLDKWDNDQVNPAPLEISEFAQKVFLFEQSMEQISRGTIKVMSDYIAGQLFMRFLIYTPVFVGKSQWELTATLKKIGADGSQVVSQAFLSPLIDMNSLIQNKYFRVEVPITDALGKINGTLIGADDAIIISLKRLTIVDDVQDLIRVVGRTEIYKS